MKEDLNNHLDDNHNPTQGIKFKCDECDKVFSHNNLLEEHIGTAHSETVFPCNLCKFVAKNEELLEEHLSTHVVHHSSNEERNQIFVCVKCSFKSKTSRGLDRHIENMCTQCDLCLAENIEVEIHSSLHSECKQKQCSFISTGTVNLKNHVAENHPKDKFPCNKCGKTLRNEKDLMTHFNENHRKHTKSSLLEAGTQTLQTENNYQCEKCDFADKDITVLVKHILDMHCLPALKIKCDLCDYTADDETFLNLHKINMHEEDAQMQQGDMMKVFYNALGNMMMETNEVLAKMNRDTNKSMWKLMESQDILEEAVKDIKKDINDIKTKESERTQKDESDPAALNEIVDSHNAIKQELFIIRKNQITEKKIDNIEKSVANLSSIVVKHFPSNVAEGNKSKPASFSSLFSSMPSTESTSRASKPKVAQPMKSGSNSTGSQTLHRQTKHPECSSSSPPPNRSYQRNPEPKTLYLGDSISANVSFDALEEGMKTRIVSAKAYSSIHDVVSNVAKKPAIFPERNFTDVIPTELAKGVFTNLIVQGGSVHITNLITKDNPKEYIEYFRQEAVLSAKNIFSACENALKMKTSLKTVIILKQIPRYDRTNVDPLCMKQALSLLYNNTLTDLWMTSPLKDRIFIGNHNIECSGSIRESRYRNTQTGAFDGIHLYGSSGRKAYTQSVLNILKQAGLVDLEFDHLNCAQSQFQRKQNGFNKNKTWPWDTDARKFGCGNKRQTNQNSQRFEVPLQNRFAGLSDINHLN